MCRIIFVKHLQSHKLFRNSPTLACLFAAVASKALNGALAVLETSSDAVKSESFFRGGLESVSASDCIALATQFGTLAHTTTYDSVANNGMLDQSKSFHSSCLEQSRQVLGAGILCLVVNLLICFGSIVDLNPKSEEGFQ